MSIGYKARFKNVNFLFRFYKVLLMKRRANNIANDVKEASNLALHALTPTVLSEDEFAPYANDFNMVFAPDSKIRNIAVSGSFGAGKSSVIETCKSKYKEQKWVNVELAHFGGQKNDDNSLEAEVLNQLVHKVGTKKAPKSRFKQTKNQSRFHDISVALISVIAILIVVQLITHGSDMFFSECIDTRNLGFTLVIALFAILFFSIYVIVRRNLIGRLVKRFKFMDAELELFPSTGNLGFNACMDDLVYLLSCSDKTAIVFEDLDRFDSIDLLEKLRELNILSNASREDAEGEPIRFFYLIRDGLFTTARDRTKFFDYIIPVIPYVDPANAQGILQQKLREIGLTVDEGFLFNLSVFIDDPRILKDIINEVNHFKTTLFSSGYSFATADAERLVAMVTYKVMFPSDYELLQVRRGYMYTLLNQRQWLIDTLCENINEEITELKERLSKIESHATLAENEIKLLFSATRFKEVSNYESRSPRVDFASLTNANEIMETIESNEDRKAAFNEIIASLEENEEYQARMKEVRLDKDRESSRCRARIKFLTSQQRNIASQNIASLIGKLGDANEFFVLEKGNFERGNDYEELGIARFMDSPDFGLVKYLVSGGWIDESYSRYMSSFRQGGISANDSDYLASLLQMAPLNSNYIPDNAEEIVRRMTPEMFERKNARNHALVAAILNEKNELKLEKLMHSVKDDPTPAFIVDYVTGSFFLSEFFDPMFNYLDNPIVEIANSENVDKNSKILFFQRLIAYGCEWLDGEEPDGFLCCFVSDVESFLDFNEECDAAFVCGLEAIGYHPVSIDVETSNQNILKMVCERGLFEPRALLVDALFSKIYGKNNLLEKGELVKEVINNPENGLSQRVNENPDFFVSSLLVNSPNLVSCDENSVLWVLNNDNISFETASTYLSAVEGFSISNICSIDNPELRAQALEQGVIKATASNVIDYFESNGKKIDESLSAYVTNYGLPKEMKGSDFESNVDASCFVIEICESEYVDADCFTRVITQLQVNVILPTDVCFSEDRISELINAGLLLMCADNLEIVRSGYQALVVDFISSDPEGYVTLVLSEDEEATQCAFDEDEVLAVFADTRISDQIKVKLLHGFTHCVRLEPSYSGFLNSKIISGDSFDPSDIDFLPNLYDSAGGELSAAILSRIKEYRQRFLESRDSYSWSFISELLGCEPIDETSALRFLANQLTLSAGGNLSREEVYKAFASAGLESFEKLLAPKSSGSMIRASAENDAVLDALEKIGMCGKRREPNKDGFYYVYAKRAK